ncbi:uncharacterized protein BDR25DRAFT_396787, partial [Lindgomyces ingoldianus]
MGCMQLLACCFPQSNLLEQVYYSGSMMSKIFTENENLWKFYFQDEAQVHINNGISAKEEAQANGNARAGFKPRTNTTMARKGRNRNIDVELTTLCSQTPKDFLAFNGRPKGAIEDIRKISACTNISELAREWSSFGFDTCNIPKATNAVCADMSQDQKLTVQRAPTSIQAASSPCRRVNVILVLRHISLITSLNNNLRSFERLLREGGQEVVGKQREGDVDLWAVMCSCGIEGQLKCVQLRLEQCLKNVHDSDMASRTSWVGLRTPFDLFFFSTSYDLLLYALCMAARKDFIVSCEKAKAQKVCRIRAAMFQAHAVGFNEVPWHPIVPDTGFDFVSLFRDETHTCRRNTTTEKMTEDYARSSKGLLAGLEKDLAVMSPLGLVSETKYGAPIQSITNVTAFAFSFSSGHRGTALTSDSVIMRGLNAVWEVDMSHLRRSNAAADAALAASHQRSRSRMISRAIARLCPDVATPPSRGAGHVIESRDAGQGRGSDAMAFQLAKLDRVSPAVRHGCENANGGTATGFETNSKVDWNSFAPGSQRRIKPGDSRPGKEPPRCLVLVVEDPARVQCSVAMHGRIKDSPATYDNWAPEDLTLQRLTAPAKGWRKMEGPWHCTRRTTGRPATASDGLCIAVLCESSTGLLGLQDFFQAFDNKISSRWDVRLGDQGHLRYRKVDDARPSLSQQRKGRVNCRKRRWWSDEHRQSKGAVGQVLRHASHSGSSWEANGSSSGKPSEMWCGCEDSSQERGARMSSEPTVFAAADSALCIQNKLRLGASGRTKQSIAARDGGGVWDLAPGIILSWPIGHSTTEPCRQSHSSSNLPKSVRQHTDAHHGAGVSCQEGRKKGLRPLSTLPPLPSRQAPSPQQASSDLDSSNNHANLNSASIKELPLDSARSPFEMEALRESPRSPSRGSPEGKRILLKVWTSRESEPSPTSISVPRPERPSFSILSTAPLTLVARSRRARAQVLDPTPTFPLLDAGRAPSAPFPCPATSPVWLAAAVAPALVNLLDLQGEHNMATVIGFGSLRGRSVGECNVVHATLHPLRDRKMLPAAIITVPCDRSLVEPELAPPGVADVMRGTGHGGLNKVGWSSAERTERVGLAEMDCLFGSAGSERGSRFNLLLVNRQPPFAECDEEQSEWELHLCCVARLGRADEAAEMGEGQRAPVQLLHRVSCSKGRSAPAVLVRLRRVAPGSLPCTTMQPALRSFTTVAGCPARRLSLVPGGLARVYSCLESCGKVGWPFVSLSPTTCLPAPASHARIARSENIDQTLTAAHCSPIKGADPVLEVPVLLPCAPGGPKVQTETLHAREKDGPLQCASSAIVTPPSRPWCISSSLNIITNNPHHTLSACLRTVGCLRRLTLPVPTATQVLPADQNIINTLYIPAVLRNRASSAQRDLLMASSPSGHAVVEDVSRHCLVHSTFNWISAQQDSGSDPQNIECPRAQIWMK